VLGVLFAPGWCLVRSMLGRLTTFGKPPCGIETTVHVKSCHYSYESGDVKGYSTTDYTDLEFAYLWIACQMA